MEGLNKIDDQWIPVQMKVFSRWVTVKSEGNEINDIIHDLSNGVVLVNLAQKLTNKRAPRKWIEQPQLDIDKIQNCELAIDMFEKDGVKIIGISGKDIFDGNQKLILGLIWSLIVHYSIGKSVQNLNKNNNNSKLILNHKKFLLAWACERVGNYPNIRDLKPYPLMMCALLDSYLPDKINFYNLDQKNHKSNAQLAIKVMKENGIPVYVYPDEMIRGPNEIDEKALLTQLAAVKNYFDNKIEENAKIDAERKIKEAREKEEEERKLKEEALKANEDDDEKIEEEKAKKEKERKEKEEARRKAREEKERKAIEEAERKAREEKERKARREEERKLKEEEALKAKEEDDEKNAQDEEKKIEEEKDKKKKERKAKEEARRKAREEKERKAKEEARRKAKEEEERKAKEEARRKAREEKERKAKEEAERKAKEEEERKAKEEARRKAREEEERKAKEDDEEEEEDDVEEEEDDVEEEEEDDEEEEEDDVEEEEDDVEEEDEEEEDDESSEEKSADEVKERSISIKKASTTILKVTSESINDASYVTTTSSSYFSSESEEETAYEVDDSAISSETMPKTQKFTSSKPNMINELANDYKLTQKSIQEGVKTRYEKYLIATHLNIPKPLANMIDELARDYNISIDSKPQLRRNKNLPPIMPKLKSSKLADLQKRKLI